MAEMRNLPAPAGDLYLIRSEKEVQEALRELPELPKAVRAGAHACPYCPQGFSSLAELGGHIQASHAIRSGQADMQPIELPDGSTVPGELVAQELVESRKRIAELEEDAIQRAKRK